MNESGQELTILSEMRAWGDKKLKQKSIEVRDLVLL
jgi:hypothetical protein